ncbi:MAG: UDP-N-acetylmuramoyl-L-alanine--D-glutamate ligase [Thermoleophilia bacterium]|nr:UDP-N-acetylmuramoyl-L-alanine--D-glutamate ligase [Thermoleophilia bacterium]
MTLPDRVLVLGLARSGGAAAVALLREGIAVVAHDTSAAATVPEGAEAVLGEWDPVLLRGVGLVIKSPGISESAPPVRAARASGIEVISEIELGARLLENPFIGVTGTNGKTTTSALLGVILAEAGMTVEVAGNIGRPLTSLVGACGPDAWIVCELSSFQLEGVTTLRPRIAVLLNLEADHLDRHDSFGAYAAAKLRLFARQEPTDVAVLPEGFGAVPGAARRVCFSGGDRLPAEPLLPGAHNRENAAAAAAAARAAGVGEEALARALSTFPGVAHRIETVAEKRGVLYINDSKATNVAAALRAFASFPGRRRHVILGGRGKVESFAPLAHALGRGDRAYLVGEAAPALRAALDAEGVASADVETLAQALAQAAAAAASGDVVLLSPACASFDQFASFEHRGEEFRRLVWNLPG